MPATPVSMAFFRRVFEDVSTKHPGMDYDTAYVDAKANTFALSTQVNRAPLP